MRAENAVAADRDRPLGLVDVVGEILVPAEIAERRDVLRDDLVGGALRHAADDPQPRADVVRSDRGARFETVRGVLGGAGAAATSTTPPIVTASSSRFIAASGQEYNLRFDMHVAAIIAAGGRGVRFGADRPKQFLDIGGRSILELSVAALAANDRIDEIVVALPDEHVDAGGESVAGRDRPADRVCRRRRPPPGFGRERVCEDLARSRRHRDSRCGAAVCHRAT